MADCLQWGTSLSIALSRWHRCVRDTRSLLTWLHNAVRTIERWASEKWSLTGHVLFSTCWGWGYYHQEIKPSKKSHRELQLFGIGCYCAEISEEGQEEGKCSNRGLTSLRYLSLSLSFLLPILTLGFTGITLASSYSKKIRIVVILSFSSSLPLVFFS